MKKSIGGVLLPVLASFLAACGHVEPSLQNGKLKDTWSNPSDRRYLRVRGIGSASKEGDDEVRRRAESREAALASARKELLSLIGGLRLAGGITVRDAMVVDSELKSTVDRLVFGSEEYRTEWADNGACVVTLQVERSTVKKMVSGIKPKDLPEPLSEPVRRFWKSENLRDKPEPDWDRGRRRNLDLPLFSTIMWAVIPGWAQMAAATDREMDPDDGVRLFLRGLAVTSGTLVLLSVAEDNMPGGNKLHPKNRRDKAYTAASGAVVLHFLGVWDGVSTLKQNRSWAMGLTLDDGMQVQVAARF